MRGKDTGDTRSHCLPGAQLSVRVELELVGLPGKVCYPTGRHEKAPVRCPCIRLAALHGAPRKQTTVSAC